MRTNLAEVYFSPDILDVKFLYDRDVFKTCNNIGANMSCRRRITTLILNQKSNIESFSNIKSEWNLKSSKTESASTSNVL